MNHDWEWLTSAEMIRRVLTSDSPTNDIQAVLSRDTTGRLNLDTTAERLHGCMGIKVRYETFERGPDQPRHWGRVSNNFFADSRSPWAWILQLESRQPPYEKRFSFAHELAHILMAELGLAFNAQGNRRAWAILGLPPGYSAVGYSEYILKERAADFYARQLLLPPDSLLPYREIHLGRLHHQLGLNASVVIAQLSFMGRLPMVVGYRQEIICGYCGSLPADWRGSDEIQERLEILGCVCHEYRTGALEPPVVDHLTGKGHVTVPPAKIQHLIDAPSESALTGFAQLCLPLAG